jgi:hypothetical protein
MSVPTAYTNKCMGRNGDLLHLLSNSLPSLKPIFSFYGAVMAVSKGELRIGWILGNVVATSLFPTESSKGLRHMGTYSFDFGGMGTMVSERSGHFSVRKKQFKKKFKERKQCINSSYFSTQVFQNLNPSVTAHRTLPQAICEKSVLLFSVLSLLHCSIA